MNKVFVRMISMLCAVVLSQSVSASIDPDAAPASHHFELAAAAIHEHLHDEYAASYESHSLEAAGDALHGALHGFIHGEATEADVVMKMEELKLNWNAFRQSLIPAGLLHMGDDELDELYQTVKDAYKEVRYLLRKAK